jgi:hypothetical protein
MDYFRDVLLRGQALFANYEIILDITPGSM